MDWGQPGRGAGVISQTPLLLDFCKHDALLKTVLLCSSLILSEKNHVFDKNAAVACTPGRIHTTLVVMFLIFCIFLCVFSVLQVGEHTRHGCYAGDRRCLASLIL